MVLGVLRLTGLTLVLITIAEPVFADDWVVTRSNTNGSCGVQPATTRPLLGPILVTKPNETEACKAAKPLKTDDASDSSKCFDYLPNTVAFCQKRDVDLSK